MRIAALSFVSLAALIASGCAPQMVEAPPVSVAEGNGLSVRLELPKRDLLIGEKLRVKVTATNTTGEPIQIVAPNGAPVLVRIVRQTPLAAEEVKYYPRSATANILSWALPAGESRAFVLMVPVEPDWPVGEVLYVTAELNGYAKVSPSVFVRVDFPPKKQPKAEKKPEAAPEKT
jgi:hypothetical protein